MQIRQLLLPIVFILASCVGDSKGSSDGGNNLTHNITGSVSFFGITDSIVKVYNTKGEKLGEGRISSDGEFTVTIEKQTPQVLFVIVSGGSYVEPVTGTTVFLTNETLETYLSFDGTSTINPIVISPVTHLKTATFRYETLTNDSSTENADLTAKNNIDSYVNYASDETTATDLTDPNVVFSTFTDEAKASVFHYGVAQFINDALLEEGLYSNPKPASDFTTIHLISNMYDDIRHDGVLDSMGSQGLIRLGSQTFDGNNYRRKISLSIIKFIKSANNRSNLTVADVFDYADELSDDVLVFGVLSPDPISNIKPVVNSISPKNNQPVIGVTDFTIDADDFAEITAIGFKFSSFSIVYASDLSEPIFSVDTTPYFDGAYDVSFFITNRGGQTIEEKFKVLLTNTGTTISNFNPFENKIVGGTYRFSVDAVDPTGFNYKKFTIDAADITGLIATPSGFRKDINTADYSDGAHTFGVEVTNAIAVTTTDSVSFVVDNTKPTITWSLSEGDFIDGSAYSINPSISDANTITSTEFFINSVFVAGNIDTTPHSLNTTSFAEGNHYINIVATDIAGNVTNLGRNIKIDNQPPTVIITWPPDGATANSNSFTVIWDQNDANGWCDVPAKLYVGGTLYAELANTSESRPVNPNNRPPGWNVIEVVVTDCTGKTASDSINVFFDPP